MMLGVVGLGAGADAVARLGTRDDRARVVATAVRAVGVDAACVAAAAVVVGPGDVDELRRVVGPALVVVLVGVTVLAVRRVSRVEADVVVPPPGLVERRRQLLACASAFAVASIATVADDAWRVQVHREGKSCVRYEMDEASEEVLRAALDVVSVLVPAWTVVLTFYCEVRWAFATHWDVSFHSYSPRAHARHESGARVLPAEEALVGASTDDDAERARGDVEMSSVRLGGGTSPSPATTGNLGDFAEGLLASSLTSSSSASATSATMASPQPTEQLSRA